MIKYKNFDIDSEKEINQFLKEHQNELILPAGMAYVGDDVCFLYDDSKEDYNDTRKKKRIASEKQFLEQREVELIGKIIDLRYWQTLMLKKNPGNSAAMVQETESQKENLEIQIRIIESIIREENAK